MSTVIYRVISISSQQYGLCETPMLVVTILPEHEEKGTYEPHWMLTLVIL